jgi:aspartate/methionine/tyrosine aminotransferase
VARLPDGELGHELGTRLLGISSEIWSAPAGPVQQAVALAFAEPAPLVERIALSRRRHGVVSAEGLAGHLLGRYGLGVLPGRVFGDESWGLRLRVATAMLYGESDEQREAALAAASRARCRGSPLRWAGCRKS